MRAETEDGDFRPRRLWRKISRYLECAGTTHRRGRRSRTERPGKARGEERLAIDRLVVEGYATEFDGPNRSRPVRLDSSRSAKRTRRPSDEVAPSSEALAILACRGWRAVPASASKTRPRSTSSSRSNSARDDRDQVGRRPTTRQRRRGRLIEQPSPTPSTGTSTTLRPMRTRHVVRMSLPAYLADALRGSPSDAALACERWLLEAPAECPTGGARSCGWGAYRRTRGW